MNISLIFSLLLVPVAPQDEPCEELIETSNGMVERRAIPCADRSGAAETQSEQDSPTRGPRGAVPRQLGQWAAQIQRNYPATALIEREEGTVRLSAKVDKNGAVADCTVTGSSGSAALDQAACDGMIRFARFWPALDRSQRGIPGKYDTAIRYVMPDTAEVSGADVPTMLNPEEWGPRLGSSLEDLRDAHGIEGVVRVGLTIDTGGRVAACKIINTSYQPQLDRAACDLISPLARFTARQDSLAKDRYIAISLGITAPPSSWMPVDPAMNDERLN